MSSLKKQTDILPFGVSLLTDRGSLDEIDLGILEILQKSCKTSIRQIANKLGIPSSTIQYRIKKLETEKIIEGYYAKIDEAKIGKSYVTITFVRAKYGPDYHKKIGQKLSQIPGVKAVYFVLGEIDFVVIAKSYDGNDFMEKLEKMISTAGIERSNTQTVARVIKEDVTTEITPSRELYSKNE